jgi:predicted outer membrane protein
MSHPNSAPRSNCAMLPMGIVALVVTMAACAASQPPPLPPPSSQATPERLGSTMMQPTDEGAAPAPAVPIESNAPAPAPVSDAQLASLDDAHLAAVIQEVDDRAVRIARVGETRATDPDVKRFARDVATSHIDAQNRFRARLSQLGIEPASGPVSDQASAEVGGERGSLRSARGKDLDRAYVDQQLRELIRASELVDRAVANVRSPELTAAVEGLRSRLAMNVRQARAIQEAVLAGKTDRRPDAYDPDKFAR